MLFYSQPSLLENTQETAARGQDPGATRVPMLMRNRTEIQWKSSSRQREPQDLKTNVQPNEHILTAGSAC